MDQAELRNLLITARDTITKSLSTPLPPVLPENLFSTPHGMSSVANIHSLTPEMHRVHSIDLSSGFNTYTGPLHFLDSHASFDAIFGNDPVMLRLTNRSKGKFTTEVTDYIRSKVHAFCNLCRLHIFCDSVQLKYVGTEVYDS